MQNSEKLTADIIRYFQTTTLFPFATKNEGKARELGLITHDINSGVDVSFSADGSIEFIEPQDWNVVKISMYKAKMAYRITGKPTLVEDTALSFTELPNGFPGPFIKWLTESIGNEGLCRLADLTVSRRALATTVFSMAFDGNDDDKVLIFRGDTWGWIAQHPLGNRGFGWDPIFIYQAEGTSKTEENRTYGQIEPFEKNRISMRMLALKNFMDLVQLVRR